MILLFFAFHLAASLQVLAASNASIKLLAPLPGDPVQKVHNVYSQGIPSAPQAQWIWSGPGNTLNCSQAIQLQVKFNITCLSQPITLSGLSDNHAQANFMGELYKSDSYDTITAVTASPIGQTCNQYYTFKFDAQNDIEGTNGCVERMAGVTFAVTQPDCCPNTHIRNSATCLCESCGLSIPGCLTCSSSSLCLTCDPNGYYISNSLCYQCAGSIPGCLTCSSSSSCSSCDPSGYYLNTSLCYVCADAIQGCLSCSSSSSCSTCDPEGYYLSNSLCYVCSDSIVGCLTCSSSSSCLTCDPDSYYLNNSLCYQCSGSIPGCLTCSNSSSCSTCDPSGYYLDTFLCYICADSIPGCLTCTSSSSCSTCDPHGYYLSNSLCFECNNSIPGCLACSNSTTCSACDTSSRYFSRGDTCFKPPDLKMFVYHLVKEPYENNVTIVIGIRPIDESLHYLSFNEAIIFTQNFTNLSTSYDNNGTLLVNFIYHRTYEGEVIPLTLSPSTSSNTSFEHYLAWTLNVTMTTNTNIPITHYTQNQYKMATIIKKAYMILTVLACFLMFLGIFVNKITGLEMMGVFQIAHFAVSNIIKFNPITYSISLNDQANGYDHTQAPDNRQLPEKLNAVKDSENVFSKLNVMLMVLYMAFALGGIMLLIHHIIRKVKRNWKWNQKLEKMTLHCFKQYSLAINLFCSLNIGFSIGIQLGYGQATIVNILMCVLLLLPLAINQISLMYCSFSEFGEFKRELKPNFEGKMYFNISLAYRVSVGFILGFLSSQDTGCIFPFFITFCYLMYLLANLPYRKGVHNYRSIISHLAILLVFGNTMYYRSMKANTSIAITTEFLVPEYAQILAITFAFLITLGVFIYDVKRKSMEMWQQYKRSGERTDQKQLRNVKDERVVFPMLVTEEILLE